MYEKKIGMAATRPSMMSRVKIGIWRKSRKRAATEAAITAPTAANVVFIQATARYSSGRSLMCARRRLSSRSGSSFLRACTNFPNMRHATCCFGVRLTLTGFAPFGSFTMWCAFSVCSPGLNRFVFVSVPRVSSFSNALLPNRLTSGFDGLRDSGFRQSHLLADPFRRSEEHTSELQSPCNLVCRLLLEKKKIINRSEPNLVAISGDLTQRARTAQFQAARKFLDAIRFPKIVVPWNHDVPLHNVLARLFR